MTEYYTEGKTSGQAVATTYYGGKYRGTVVQVFAPLAPETQLTAEAGTHQLTLIELLALAGQGKES